MNFFFGVLFTMFLLMTIKGIDQGASAGFILWYGGLTAVCVVAGFTED